MSEKFPGGKERFESIKRENNAIIRYAKDELDSISREWGKKQPHATYYAEKIANVKRSADDLTSNIEILKDGMEHQDGIVTGSSFKEQKFKE